MPFPLCRGNASVWRSPHTPSDPIDARVEPFDQTISLHPELPARTVAAFDGRDWRVTVASPDGTPGGSAVLEFTRRVGMFRNIISEDGAGLRRLAGFYLRQDWSRFNEEGNSSP